MSRPRSSPQKTDDELAKEHFTTAREREALLRAHSVDRESLLMRLNESAIASHSLGNFADEATCLMHVAKFLHYVK